MAGRGEEEVVWTLRQTDGGAQSSTSYVPSSLAACRPGKSSVQTENVF